MPIAIHASTAKLIRDLRRCGKAFSRLGKSLSAGATNAANKSRASLRLEWVHAVSPQEILDYVEQTVDTTGWIRKYVTFEEPFSAIVTIAFKDSEPRTFHLVSKNAFTNFENVRIYEVKP